MSGRARAVFTLAFGITLLAAHLGVRMAGARQYVDTGLDRPLFVSADSYYHAHRTRLLHDGFPRLAFHDRFMFHPEGAKAEWPLGFDWSVAAGLKAVSAVAGWSRAVWLLPFVAALLSVAGLALFFLLARRHLSEAAAWVASAALALNVAFVRITAAGEYDHHGQEVTGVVLLLLVPAAVGRRGTAVATGLALAWLAWQSTVLAYLIAGFLGIWLIARMAAAVSDRPPAMRAFAAALGAGITVVCAIEAAGRGAPFALHTLSLLHAGAVLLLLAAHLAMGRVRFVWIGAGVLAPLLVVAALMPDAFGWAASLVLGKDQLLANVSEARPLFVSREGFTLSYAHAYFGVLYVVFPAVFLLVRRRGALPPALLWFALTLFLLAFSQKRFAHLFVPPFLLVTVASVDRWLAGARWALVAVAVLLVEPAATTLRPWRWGPSSATVDGIALARAMRALPGHGAVAAPPNLGSVINWVADRPSVTNAFFYPRYLRFDHDLRALRGTEELVSFLRARRIELLVAADDARYRTMLARLFDPASEQRLARLEHAPCSAALLAFAHDRLACQAPATAPALQRVTRLESSGDPARLWRRLALYRITSPP